MLKMMGKGIKENGEPVTLVVFGLSYKNLELLKQGKPIKFSGDTVGLSSELEFTIFSGPSEREMQDEFDRLIGPDTEVRIAERLKN